MKSLQSKITASSKSVVTTNIDSDCHSLGNLTKWFDEVNLNRLLFSALRFLRNDKQTVEN
ncbi:hypothetical protein [Epilithonimonas lactis]|uniref:hypothetical protein n=1 Tax=Epilithonimonas lactis TaxID=421072 RepID=UPI00103FC5BD|nr:hypothetical protein [Epilithonimonas lactis]